MDKQLQGYTSDLYSPLLGGEAQCFPCGLHDLSSPGFVLRALRAQETTQLVLLLGKICTGETVNGFRIQSYRLRKRE